MTKIDEIWMYDPETDRYFHYIKDSYSGKEYENGTLIDREE